LAVSLALNDTLSNFFAGLHLLLSRQIRNGDFIRLDSGQEGYVTDISLHNTTIQQLTNDVVIIPNTKISSAIVVNYTYGKLPDSAMLVPIEVDVDSNNDLDKLEALSRDVAIEVMQQVPGGVPNFKPLIYYKTLGGSTIHYTVTLKAQSYVNHYLLRHEFIKRLKHRLDIAAQTA
jgi:small-conductance mechanosensitive channel